MYFENGYLRSHSIEQYLERHRSGHLSKRQSTLYLFCLYIQNILESWLFHGLMVVTIAVSATGAFGIEPPLWSILVTSFLTLSSPLFPVVKVLKISSAYKAGRVDAENNKPYNNRYKRYSQAFDAYSAGYLEG
ncbi:hypothetical protein VCSRO82_3431 [Vibrio cholerae]|uniref:hypothetical protein n=1 Tax=Vibrio cholerae TaxID=666 RepID=UPI0011D50366|nr:hypothetical protein [Vibrio cholerae]MBJ6953161.1 hypothetical protein [Vibrio cholerae]TXZ36489.1 hypothetical protein FXE69_02375 [Vibrio cholerae]GHZ91748.1 hypothetical protein VCSRO82_3431 [Vibrio cholerae]